MNLAVLQKSRSKLAAGDIFVMRLPTCEYLFGRVAITNANVLRMGNALVVYIYNARSERKTPVPDLSRDELLLPPTLINRLPWSRGYFETIERRPLTSTDCLPQHCFETFRGEYVDEFGNQLSGPTEPHGVWALSSFRTIDDDISDALGIPRSPD